MAIYSTTQVPAGHYVYAYLREDHTPYYVGKGQGKRAWNKGKYEVSPPVDQSRIVIVAADLTEVGALALERRLVRWYGRKDTETGILRNRTDGGDGASGVIRSEAHKQAISKAIKGRVGTMLGKKQSEEVLEKYRLASKNRPKKVCPHCSKEVFPNAFALYHGDKCKAYQISSNNI